MPKTHLGILLERQHDLRCSVPPSGDVFRHKTSLSSRRLRSFDRASKTKVAYLEIAIRVEKQVRGLKITVYDIGGV